VNSETTVLGIGEEIFSRSQRYEMNLFDKRFWSGKIMDWSMKDPAFKTEMFRFVDVLPALNDGEQVVRHLREYFFREGLEVPAFVRAGLGVASWNSLTARLAASAIRKNVVGMAKTFITGDSAADARRALKKLWDSGLTFTVDVLGEAVVSEREAVEHQKVYLDLLRELAREMRGWDANPVLERSALGPIPRTNVSVKCSSLYSQIDPSAFRYSVERIKERLRPILVAAVEEGVFVNLDMEQNDYRNILFTVAEELFSEPALAKYPHFGIVVQAYLKDALQDLERVIALAQKRGAPVTVRLVKGAYWDFEVAAAQSRGWPVPVFEQKAATDANYERVTDRLLDAYPHVLGAFGSHNVRSLAYTLSGAQKRGLPKDALEVQMLFGMAAPYKRALVDMGYRVREYAPVGDLLPGMAYLVRRLLENTSNEGFLRASYVDGVDRATLLRDPRERVKAAGAASPTPPQGASAVDRPVDSSLASASASSLATAPDPARASAPTSTSAFAFAMHQESPMQPAPSEFRNEPFLDFTREENRSWIEPQIQAWRARFPLNIPAVVGGEELRDLPTQEVRNPSRTSEVVARGALATTAHADRAVELCQTALVSWGRRPPAERIAVLRRAAELLRERKRELIALMVLEVGKHVREADADVAEAIDFCTYYADEMEILARPRSMMRLTGESNEYGYRPRGTAVAIAPWNFPLAILCGMTVAPLVAGDPVIMKPAEQSPAIAYELYRILIAAGVPTAALHFVPGAGETVGAHLVRHPQVHVISFTGSRAVGLKIIEDASRVVRGQKHVKKVVAEMGGKNAIVIDDDADLDEAVTGVLHSAFGFQGQKCSACSRVIVVESAYERFKDRLREAIASLRMGVAEDPASKVGPVIDEESRRRLEGVLERNRAKILAQIEVPAALKGQGNFVPVTLFEEKEGFATELGQAEFFGPLLAIFKARDLDEALRAANDVEYALTGGFYSRSPKNIERVREEFEVGNLYINRNITGALVGRQPFGGYKLSGVGAKAGGPDYLLQFLEPRTVTENTMRRGFAPSEDAGSA
jgi:RHH-type proline utilization regulon transcriptional repressor/proline dehydrogenase/delta 1-pyrroline-5-carboxylate dehydrogenase